MDDQKLDREQHRHADEEPGARGGDRSESADSLPPAPTDDGTPLGDTDQHSRVSSDRNA